MSTRCRLSINVQHSVVKIVSRDRFDQLPREGRFGFSARDSALLQESQGGCAQPDGALVAYGSTTTASWRSQADPRLATAHFKCADVAPKLLGYVVRSHATPFNHLRDGGEHRLGENFTSHSDLPIGRPGSMLSRIVEPLGSIRGWP